MIQRTATLPRNREDVLCARLEAEKTATSVRSANAFMEIIKFCFLRFVDLSPMKTLRTSPPQVVSQGYLLSYLKERAERSFLHYFFRTTLLLGNPAASTRTEGCR